MDILPYTDEHRKFRERLRTFLEKEVTPFVDRWEKKGIVPRSAWEKMGENGFLCTAVEKKYGGMGADFLHSVIVSEELVATRHSGLMAYLHSDIIVPYITEFGTEEQKERYLPDCVSGKCITAIAMTEPNAGSDLAGMNTTARTDGDHVVIDGAKIFISNGINCDLVIVAARDPETANPHEALSLYIVEAGTPGFQKGKKLEKLGYHSQDTAELFFTGCRIPRSRILGKKGAGFYMLMEKLQQERLMCAVGAVAGSEMIWNIVADHCKKTIYKGKPLSRHQAVSFTLVEMATEIRLGRTFVDRLVLSHMQGEKVIVETAMAKYWTCDLINRIADRSLDLYGERGMFESCPIVRIWRDVKVMPIFAGTNEIMKVVASRFMGL